MDMYEGIMTTRAMRRYTQQPISDDEIMLILRAAQQAPSGGNIQPWQFLVVTDEEVKSALGGTYQKAFDRYENALLANLPPFRSEADEASFRRTLAASRHLAEHLAEAPALVMVLMPTIDLTLEDEDGPIDIGTLFASVYPAVQNLILAARSLGIGSALTTVHRVYDDDVKQLLGVPDGFETAALVPLGRPSGRFGVARRRPVEKVTHWNRFGERRS